MFWESLWYTISKMCSSDEVIKLGSTEGKEPDYIRGYVYGISIGLDFGTDLGSIDRCFDDYNDGKLEGLLLFSSLKATVGKVIGTDEGIKLGYPYGEVFIIKLGEVYGIKLGLDVRIYMGSLDGPFDGCNIGKIEDLVLGESLEYNDGKMLGSDEVINLVSTDGKVLDTMLENVDVITLGLAVGS